MDTTPGLSRPRAGLLLLLAGLAAPVSGCKLSDSGVAPPAGLVYAVNPAVYGRGTAIAPNSPSSSGGVVAGYSVSPALPAGLAMNETTGVVTGTPTAVAPAAAYTVTASNAGGSATVALSIAVNDVAPSALAYAVNPATYTVGVAIAPNAPSASGGRVVAWSVSPALPAGLSLDTSTGVISGTPSALAPSAAYRVTATNSGGSAHVDVTLEVNALAPASIAYAVNPAAYFATVAIEPNDPSFTGGQPSAWEVSPDLPNGLLLHPVTGRILGTPISAAAAANYRVTGRNSGGAASVDVRITVNPAPPVVTVPPQPQTVLGGTAATFTVTATGAGALSYQWRKRGVAIPGATSAAYTTPGTALADDGAVFSVVVTDPQGGSTASEGARLTVTAPPANVYVVNGGSGTVSQFSAGTDGSLVAMAAPTVAIGAGGFAVVVDPSGRWVYVTNRTAGTISQFARAANGALEPLSPATVAAGADPGFLAVHPQGGFLYAVEQAADVVHQYAIGADGTLSPLPVPAVATGGSPSGIALASSGGALHAFVTTLGPGNVSRYAVGGDGALARLLPDADGIGASWQMVVNPAGTRAYATNLGSTLLPGFAVGPGGSIVADQIATSVGFPTGIAMDPGGRWVYTSSPTCSGTGCDVLNQFAIGGDGSLAPMSPRTVATGARPYMIAVSPGSEFLWVTDGESTSVSQYAIGPTGGLTPLSTPYVLVGDHPYGITAVGPRSP
jgi:DNA-binding beta-propeller fold protein YncE